MIIPEKAFVGLSFMTTSSQGNPYIFSVYW